MSNVGSFATSGLIGNNCTHFSSSSDVIANNDINNSDDERSDSEEAIRDQLDPGLVEDEANIAPARNGDDNKLLMQNELNWANYELLPETFVHRRSGILADSSKPQYLGNACGVREIPLDRCTKKHPGCVKTGFFRPVVVKN